MKKEEMKQYTGTKTVKAMPMTMGEAYERKLLKEGVRPSECETDKAGYLVEYEGGYQSWFPAEPFEKAYKPSETFLDRLSIEREELNERFTALDSFLDKGYSYIIEKVGVLQASLLISQHLCMSGYLNILNSRILYMETATKQNSQRV